MTASSDGQSTAGTFGLGARTPRAAADSFISHSALRCPPGCTAAHAPTPFENRFSPWIQPMADVRILLTTARLPTPKRAGTWLAIPNWRASSFRREAQKDIHRPRRSTRGRKARASSIRVAIGEASEISTRTARATAKEYLAQISRGQHPKAEKRMSEDVKAAITQGEAGSGGITLRQACERYRDAHMVRKGRSERTIESYRDHVERIFEEWLHMPLKHLGLDPSPAPMMARLWNSRVVMIISFRKRRSSTTGTWAGRSRSKAGFACDRQSHAFRYDGDLARLRIDNVTFCETPRSWATGRSSSIGLPEAILCCGAPAAAPKRWDRGRWNQGVGSNAQ